jgi:hypothetical protein
VAVGGLRNAECPNPWEVAVALARYRRNESRSSLETPKITIHREGGWRGSDVVKREALNRVVFGSMGLS